MPIERCYAQHDPRKTGDQELKEKAYREEHRRLEVNLSAPHRRQPVEYLDAGRNSDSHRREHEKGVGVGVHANREHVMGPDAHTDERNAD